MLLILYFASAYSHDFIYFKQTIDHFESSMAYSFFSQRLILDHKYSKSRFETLVIYLDELASLDYLVRPFPSIVESFAQKKSASLLKIEPRYFGESFPFDILSTENMAYNTVEQMVEDIATIIHYVKENFSNDKVILIGNGFGASLACWIRLKYPQLCDAVWASRAILRVDRYDEDADKAIYKKMQSIDDCNSATDTLMRRLEATMTHGDNESKQNIIELFEFDNNIDSNSVLYELAEVFVLMAKTQSHNGAKLLTEHCLQQSKNPSIEQFAKLFKKTLDYFHFTTDSFDPRIGISQNTLFKNERSMLYLRCNQIGNFHVYNKRYYLRSRSINMKYFDQLCNEAFNFDKVADNNSFNIRYGNLEKGASSIFFSYSQNDIEYNLININNNTNMSIYVNVIKQESYGDELFNQDDKELRTIQENAFDLLNKWTDFSNKKTCSEHGIVVLDKCKCDDGYSGEFCQNFLVSPRIFKAFVSLTSFIPTFLFLFFIILGWVKLIVFSKVNRPIVF